MISRERILEILPPYRGIKKLIIDEQDTHDIINEIVKAHKFYGADYDKISSLFWKGNARATCRYIFDFLKSNVSYSIETERNQSVKSPAAIVATGLFENGNNDCKHYSLFIAGILDSLKRNGTYDFDWNFRFANYNYFKKDPQHVFVVVNDNDEEIWVDPVLDYFDEKKSFVNAIDKKIDSMALYKISGVPINKDYLSLMGCIHNYTIGDIASSIASVSPVVSLFGSVLGTLSNIFKGGQSINYVANLTGVDTSALATPPTHTHEAGFRGLIAENNDVPLVDLLKFLWQHNILRLQDLTAKDAGGIARLNSGTESPYLTPQENFIIGQDLGFIDKTAINPFVTIHKPDGSSINGKIQNDGSVIGYDGTILLPASTLSANSTITTSAGTQQLAAPTATIQPGSNNSLLWILGIGIGFLILKDN